MLGNQKLHPESRAELVASSLLTSAVENSEKCSSELLQYIKAIKHSDNEKALISEFILVNLIVLGSRWIDFTSVQSVVFSEKMELECFRESFLKMLAIFIQKTKELEEGLKGDEYFDIEDINFDSVAIKKFNEMVSVYNQVHENLNINSISEKRKNKLERSMLKKFNTTSVVLGSLEEKWLSVVEKEIQVNFPTSEMDQSLFKKVTFKHLDKFTSDLEEVRVKLLPPSLFRASF